MFPVTWQIVANTHDGNYHLFQRDAEIGVPPTPGLLLANIAGVPSVVGPSAGYDNMIVRVLWDGKTERALCQLHGFRAADQNLEEVKEDLDSWEHIAQLDPGTVNEI